jgi:putative sterol carrier protein
MLFAFDADVSLPRGKRLLIRLEAGRCAGAEFLDGDTHPDAGFTLRAPFSVWQSILERRMMAASAILTGKLAVEGDKMKLLKHTAAHRALVYCAASVDTVWD